MSETVSGMLFPGDGGSAAACACNGYGNDWEPEPEPEAERMEGVLKLVKGMGIRLRVEEPELVCWGECRRAARWEDEEVSRLLAREEPEAKSRKEYIVRREWPGAAAGVGTVSC
jgi:hypothetical protein